jgi:hypothetical protein
MCMYSDVTCIYIRQNQCIKIFGAIDRFLTGKRTFSAKSIYVHKNHVTIIDRRIRMATVKMDYSLSAMYQQ